MIIITLQQRWSFSRQDFKKASLMYQICFWGKVMFFIAENCFSFLYNLESVVMHKLGLHNLEESVAISVGKGDAKIWRNKWKKLLEYPDWIPELSLLCTITHYPNKIFFGCSITIIFSSYAFVFEAATRSFVFQLELTLIAYLGSLKGKKAFPCLKRAKNLSDILYFQSSFAGAMAHLVACESSWKLYDIDCFVSIFSVFKTETRCQMDQGIPGMWRNK